MHSKPFVLALSGPPGAGKSTLASLLQRRHAGTRLISFDNYQSLTRLSQTQIQDWFVRGADIDEVDHSEIIADLRRETDTAPDSGPQRLLLFETPFGRLHRETGAFIDLLVWIDTPLDLALARAILSFSRDAQRNPAPQAARDFIEWQIRYMYFYPVVRAMYVAQRERIAPSADLSIDGCGPAELSAEIIEQALAARGIDL